MDATPTLYVWNPRLDEDDEARRTIRLTLTPLGSTNTVSIDQSTCVEILEATRIAGFPVRWSSTPFRTSYYSAPDASAHDRWRIVWDSLIEVDRTLNRVPLQRYEYFEIAGGGSYALVPPEEAEELECRIIADFRQAVKADRARHEIRNLEPAAGFRVLDLGGSFTQLDVSLGRFTPDAFTHAFERGERVERVCRKQGGIPNSTEREDKWDIVFNEGGVE